MRNKKERPADKYASRQCRECAYLSLIYDNHTLSLKGKPTLGRCPYVTNRCVIVSEKACEHFKE